MTSRFRSSSLGAVPHQKPLSRSRAESSQAAPLEVRCACQFFQSDSLIPERINPIGSRPPSRVDSTGDRPVYCSKHNIFEEDHIETIEEENLSGSLLSFGKNSVPDYYAETNDTYHIPTTYETFQSIDKENQPPQIPPLVVPTSTSDYFQQPLNFVQRPLSFDDRHIPPIELETFRADFPIINLNENSNHIISPISNNNNKIHPLKGQFSSQKSLDRYSTSTLLAKYRQKSHSQAPSLHGSTTDIRMLPRMTKTVSFDYVKAPSANTNASVSNVNPNYDQYHRMSPMVFPVRERITKMERMSVTR